MGKSKADRAIEALTAEREQLHPRLKKVEAEMVRWDAIRNALVAAKEALPSFESPIDRPADDRLELGPLPPPADPPPAPGPRELKPLPGLAG